MNWVGPLARDFVPFATVDLMLHVSDKVEMDLKGLCHAALTSLAASRHVRIPRQETYQQLVSICATFLDLTNQYAFGGENIPRSSDEEVKIFCSCLVDCRNLGEALEKAGIYTKVFDNRGTLRGRREGEDVIFSMQTNIRKKNVTTLISDLFSLFFFYRFFSWIIATPLELHRFSLAHPRLVDEDLLVAITHCPIEFDAADNAIVFASDVLSRPIVRTHGEVAEVLCRAPFQFLSPEMRLPEWLESVFRRAMLNETEIPHIEHVAESLGQSVSTFRRRLEKHQVSFQGLLDKCRREMALGLLAQPHLTMEKIAAKLSFSDTSCFSRAFKVWTGNTPSAHRKMLNIKT